MSSRRQGGSTKRSARRDALKKLKRNRDAGVAEIDTVNVEEDSLFQEMTEGEYESMVRARRDETPFVEDDQGELGYYDDGEEQFFEDNDNYDQENDDDLDIKGGGGQQRQGALSIAYARRAKKKQRAKMGNDLDNNHASQKVMKMFMSKGKMTKASGSSGRLLKKPKVDIDLDGMLGELDANPTSGRMTSSSTTTVSSRRQRNPYAVSRRVPPPQVLPNRASVDHTVSDNDDNMMMMEDEEVSNDMPPQEEENVVANAAPEDATKVKDDNNATESPVEKKPELSIREKMFLKAKSRETKVSAATIASLNEKPPSTTTSTAKTLPTNEVSEWWSNENGGDDQQQSSSSTATEEAASSSTPSDSKRFVNESPQTIKIYWLDAIEIRGRPGKLYLVGKMKDTDNTFKSVCVEVSNLKRTMYFVPRKDTDDEKETWSEMHTEVSKMLIPSIITEKKDQQAFETEMVKRNYAFESTELRRGISSYLKVSYPSKYYSPSFKAIESGGKTFSSIAGATSSPLELFLIKQKLMGPCWIEIPNAKRIGITNSFCQMEFTTSDSDNITPIISSTSESDDYCSKPPPLSVMSLSIKTYCNPKTQKQEIVSISWISQQNVRCDSETSNISSFSHMTLIRPIDDDGGSTTNSSFPPSYVNALKRDNRFSPNVNIRVEANERSLLNFFLVRVLRLDPDVLVGHNIHKYGLEVLVSRMDAYNLGGAWSRLTRLRRGRLTPFKEGEGWNEYHTSDLCHNGRLVVDTYVAAKELLSSQPNYTLTHLIQSQLGKDRVDIDISEIPLILSSNNPAAFVSLCRHTVDDALFILHLVHRLQVLPLSKQLASLCGYLWSKTLEANKRAERIEYLLLHEFDAQEPKFIVPDKEFKKTKGKKSKNPSYSGGMVFAPKKGFYDRFVVLLDFMSLYPSIIREYNICFTTVDRQLISNNTEENESEIPNLPPGNAQEGVLPAVIKRLLSSRKAVKKELKVQEAAGNVESAKRLDIRQKAIKLTANSMYGCLGFKNSRFYAKPIAALITSTGRQTLMKAAEVATDECGYDVVYGDTDSIMVDSKSNDLAEAKRIGREIQVKCNKKFKLLELEVDYIFKCILLLNKKKYAAIVVHESPNNNNDTSKITLTKEVKGLDMVRRDWCILSKEVGGKVLDFILSGTNSRESLVEAIHEYLRTVAADLQSQPLSQFVITKSLNKAPESYPDKAKQYHVQVALAMKSSGQPIGVGCHIPYVLCNEPCSVTGRKAYHPDEVEKAFAEKGEEAKKSALTIDYQWYLEAQLHPPINRLCAHIDGTSSAELAHCLGLEGSKFSHYDAADDNDAGIENIVPSVLQDDSERFKDCDALEITCMDCNVKSVFVGVTKDSFNCPSCNSLFYGMASKGINDRKGDNFVSLVSNLLAKSIRSCTEKYYRGWTVCTDAMCANKTQQQSLRGKHNACLVPGCRGIVRPVYSDSELYTQLTYYSTLFDTERASKKLKETAERNATQKSSETDTKKSMSSLLLPNDEKEAFKTLYDQMQKSIRRNEYNWVQPSVWCTLFKA